MRKLLDGNIVSRDEELRAKEILSSYDHAFEWLLFLLSILVAILFQFLTWIAEQPILVPDDQGDLPQVTELIASFSVPLIFAIMSWFLKIIALGEEKKMFRRLFAWSISYCILIYYMIVLIILLSLMQIPKAPFAWALVMIIMIHLLTSSRVFPIGRIAETYKATTIFSCYWSRPYGIAKPYALGIASFSVIFLISIYLL